MWIIPRSLDYLCSQDQDVLNLELNLLAPEVEFWVMSRKILSPQPLSWRGWRTRVWSQHLFGAARSKNSIAPYLREWILSQQASHVRQSQLLENKKVLKIQDGYGPKLQKSFAKYDQKSSSWKMSPRFLDQKQSKKSLGTWPIFGSMQNGECFQQRMWERPMHANVSSSWPTPKTLSGGAEKKSSRLARKSGGLDLNSVVSTWPTPLARDMRHQGFPGTLTHLVTTGLRDQMIMNHGVDSLTKTQALHPALNCRFVEKLMGWPKDWSDPCSPHALINYTSWEILSRLLLLHLLGQSCGRESASNGRREI